MTFYIFTNGTLADATQVNSTFSYLTKKEMINFLNNQKASISGSTEQPNAVYDLFNSDTATTKTNWTYDSTNKWYINTQTSAGSLAFTNMLSPKQKLETPVITKVYPLVIFDDAGAIDTSIVSNNSFETAGVGSPDIFANWTESITLPGVGTAAWTQASSGSGITNGSKCASWNGTVTSTSPGPTPGGTLTQSITLNGHRYIGIDWYGQIQQTSGTTLAQTISFTISCGSASDGSSVTSSGTSVVTGSGTIVLDVANITGTNTLTISMGGFTGWISRTYVYDLRFDNIRPVKFGGGSAISGSISRIIQVTANNGTNWETVPNGSWYTLSNTGSDLGCRILEIRTDADSLLSDKVIELGMFYQ